MDYRQLGRSGLSVPVLTLGTGTFGGKAALAAWGATDAAEATRLIDICLEHGLTMFDSADIYSGGASEEVLGAAIKGRRDKVLISTKATFRSGAGANDGQAQVAGVGSVLYPAFVDPRGALPGNSYGLPVHRQSACEPA